MVWFVSPFTYEALTERTEKGELLMSDCPPPALCGTKDRPTRFNLLARIDPKTREVVLLPAQSLHISLTTDFPCEESERDGRDRRAVNRKSWDCKRELVCVLNGGVLMLALVNHPRLKVRCATCSEDHVALTQTGVLTHALNSDELKFRYFMDLSLWFEGLRKERLLLPRQARRARALFPFDTALHKPQALRPDMFKLIP